MSMVHPLDRALLAASPLLPNLYGGLPEVAVGGKDFVGAANGVYVRAATPALRVCLPVAEGTLPFAPMGPAIIPANGPIPLALVQQFIDWAASTPAQEIAAVVEVHGQGYRLRRLLPASSGSGHVTYDDGQVDDDALVMDLHSHGRHRAYFSDTDDQSDLSRRGPYIAAVVGQCGTANDVALRVVLPPYLLPLRLQNLIDHGVIA